MSAMSIGKRFLLVTAAALVAAAPDARIIRLERAAPAAGADADEAADPEQAP